MSLRAAALALPVLVSLPACAVQVGMPAAPEAPSIQPVTTPGQFLDKVAGKPITFENGGTLIANPDGSFGGDFAGRTPRGSWTFTGGQLCRTVTIGQEDFPRVCNLIEAGENVVRFLNLDGTLSAEAELG
jgi:hypothetical protein